MTMHMLIISRQPHALTPHTSLLASFAKFEHRFFRPYQYFAVVLSIDCLWRIVIEDLRQVYLRNFLEVQTAYIECNHLIATIFVRLACNMLIELRCAPPVKCVGCWTRLG